MTIRGKNFVLIATMGVALMLTIARADSGIGDAVESEAPSQDSVIKQLICKSSAGSSAPAPDTLTSEEKMSCELQAFDWRRDFLARMLSSPMAGQKVLTAQRSVRDPVARLKSDTHFAATSQINRSPAVSPGSVIIIAE